MKTIVITAATTLLVCAAIAAPLYMHSPKPMRAPSTPTPTPEAVFVPIPACRAFSNQNLSPGTARHFVISGTNASQFKSQGGPSGGCGIPVSATAVTISLTAQSSDGDGSITAYPYGTTSSPSRALSFQANHDQTAGVTVGLGNNNVALRANGNTAKATGDVTGYFAQQIEAYVNSDGTLYSQTARILGAEKIDTGEYSVTVDRDVYYCSALATSASGSGPVVAYTGLNGIVSVFTYNNGAIADSAFNLSVQC